jgi:hypothetical protein
VKQTKIIHLGNSPEEMDRIEKEMQSAGWQLVEWVEQFEDPDEEIVRDRTLKFERDAVDPAVSLNVRETVARLTAALSPSLLGRLIYLSSKCGENGRYFDGALSSEFSLEESELALREEHGAVFSHWLRMSLEDRKSDLDIYLAGSDGKRRNVVRRWLRGAPYKQFIPSSAEEAERILFISELDTLINLLATDLGLK